ncbi:hypothetical protein [Nocardia sp. NPDC051570]|uniref:hypothetical protein n=1 Tax=Nocardia sp. NPDC051570 TaxID=3364324 RepID=UPI003798D855
MSTERVCGSRTLECGAVLCLLAQLFGSIAVELGVLGGAMGVLVGWGAPAWFACGFGLRVAYLSMTPIPVSESRNGLRVKATALAAATAIITACTVEGPGDSIAPAVSGTVLGADEIGK